MPEALLDHLVLTTPDLEAPVVACAAIHPADPDGFVATARERGVELGDLVTLARRTDHGLHRWQ